jgi:hypothetical protein
LNESLEILKHGAAPILALVVYALVYHIVVPLVARNGNGKRNGPGQQWSHQEYINTIQGKRLDRHDADLSDLRHVVGEVRESLVVAQAILERIEKSL